MPMCHTRTHTHNHKKASKTTHAFTRACVRVYVCDRNTYVCVCVRVCLCVGVRLRLGVVVCERALGCAHACVCVRTTACARLRVRVRVRVRTCVCVSAGVRAYAFGSRTPATLFIISTRRASLSTIDVNFRGALLLAILAQGLGMLEKKLVSIGGAGVVLPNFTDFAAPVDFI